jgi:acid stress-induced BolA-like protein IbaG/YrbA
MFDPMTDRKVKLCEVAAQLAADGDVAPCAAARLAVAKELREKARFMRQAALRADKTVYMQRDRAHADELEQAAAKLEWEAKTCTATA